MADHKYPEMARTLHEKKTGSKFRLQVTPGSFRDVCWRMLTYADVC